MKLEDIIIPSLLFIGLSSIVLLGIQVRSEHKNIDCPPHQEHPAKIIKPSVKFDPYKLRTIWI